MAALYKVPGLKKPRKRFVFAKIFLDGPITKYEVQKSIPDPRKPKQHFAATTVKRVFDDLEKKGFIHIVRKTKRTMRKKKFYDVTDCGVIQAGRYWAVPIDYSLFPIYFSNAWRRAIESLTTSFFEDLKRDMQKADALGKEYGKAFSNYSINFCMMYMFGLFPVITKGLGATATFNIADKIKKAGKSDRARLYAVLTQLGRLKEDIETFRHMIREMEAWQREGHKALRTVRKKKAKPPHYGRKSGAGA